MSEQKQTTDIEITGIREEPSGRRSIGVFGQLVELCRITIRQGSDGTEEAQRARLYAAAPALAEALKLCLEEMGMNATLICKPGTFEAARAALKQAGID